LPSWHWQCGLKPHVNDNELSAGIMEAIDAIGGVAASTFVNDDQQRKQWGTFANQHRHLAMPMRRRKKIQKMLHAKLLILHGHWHTFLAGFESLPTASVSQSDGGMVVPNRPLFCYD